MQSEYSRRIFRQFFCSSFSTHVKPLSSIWFEWLGWKKNRLAERNVSPIVVGIAMTFAMSSCRNECWAEEAIGLILVLVDDLSRL